MSKPRMVRATFSNGVTKTRSSTSRVYTHAYLFISKGGSAHFGFSASEAQCLTNLEAESAWVRRNQGPLQFAEVIPVEIVR